MALLSSMIPEGSHFEGIGMIAPELTLLLFSMIGLVVDLVKRGRDSHLVGYVTLAGIALAAFLLIGDFGAPSQTVMGLVVVD